jgi:3-isopropylmalate/(R)-2-methylmalate dehydratase small subunit
MLVEVTGRLWQLGDDIDTDVLYPGRFMTIGAATGRAALEGLASVDPELANIKPGDGLVAGRNFGCGSSREYAVTALREIGVRLVLARSFARIFYRNAINLGLPVLEYEADTEIPPMSGPIEADLRSGAVVHRPTGERYQARPIPDFLADLVERGGLMPYLRAVVAAPERSDVR